MTEQNKTGNTLQNELQILRQENRVLQAQLSLHKKIFKEVNNALGIATNIQQNMQENDTLSHLLKENELLKNKLKIQQLSVREKEILKLILRNYTSKEIAHRLKISKLTVDTHRKKIQQKLEVSSMVELVKLAMWCE